MTDCYLTCNFFELFEVPVSYYVDLDVVHRAYMDLQKQVHPDNYANESDERKRISMQQTSRVNEAYNTLKDGVMRAAYMLTLKGVDIRLSNETTKDMAFLMEQMQTRERLENIRKEADPLSALDDMAEQVKATTQTLAAAFEQAFDNDELEQARECVRKLQFMKKAKNEIESAMADIEDEMMS